MRGLSEGFLYDLKEGRLAELTKMVKADTSLCLEIRDNYINVYYRGGNLMKVEKGRTRDDYRFSFDQNYFKGAERLELDPLDIPSWLEASPGLKRAMDWSLSKARKDEREFQQLLLRDNNFGSIARGTDYYICDIEFQSKLGRFDMVGVHWPSRTPDRKNAHDRRLVFVEVKHGDGALDGSSGLHSHVDHVNTFAGDGTQLEGLKQAMTCVFHQKMELGLINCGKNLESFGNGKPLFLLALINQDPDHSKLDQLLATMPHHPNIDVRVAISSFLGYGLYGGGLSVEQARKFLGERR